MSSEQQGEKRAINGGCHCGRKIPLANYLSLHHISPQKPAKTNPPLPSFIKYTAKVTLNAQGNLSATRCNCTFCQKLGNTNLTISSPSDFTLHSPPSRSQLSDYAPRVKSVHRYFCPTCGSHVWMEGAFPYEGKMFPVFAVNACSVEQPQEGVELRRG
ncbi:hypothetical protein Q7P37_000661 [Cladosporium fusiforme]